MIVHYVLPSQTQGKPGETSALVCKGTSMRKINSEWVLQKQWNYKENYSRVLALCANLHEVGMVTRYLSCLFAKQKYDNVVGKPPLEVFQALKVKGWPMGFFKTTFDMVYRPDLNKYYKHPSYRHWQTAKNKHLKINWALKIDHPDSEKKPRVKKNLQDDDLAIFQRQRGRKSYALHIKAKCQNVDPLFLFDGLKRF